MTGAASLFLSYARDDDGLFVGLVAGDAEGVLIPIRWCPQQPG